MLGNRDAPRRVMKTLFSFFSLSDAIIVQFVCGNFRKYYQWRLNTLRKRFGNIYTIGLKILVSNKHILDQKHIYNFVDGINMMHRIKVCKLALEFEKYVFVYDIKKKWSVSLPCVFGTFGAFHPRSLRPARLNHYHGFIVVDTGKGVAMVMKKTEKTYYFYYDSKILGDHECKFIKGQREIICSWSWDGNMIKNYVTVPDDIRDLNKMTEKELLKTTVLMDPRNSCAFIYNTTAKKYYFLDQRHIKLHLLADSHKKCHKKCLNKID